MKTILFSILILFSINGFAFNWKKVSGNELGDLYVDVDNIKKRNGLVYYWILVENLETTSNGVNSSIGKLKVDCVIETATQLQTIFYSQSMGRGKIMTQVTSNEIVYPPPNSVLYGAMKFACENAK